MYNIHILYLLLSIITLVAYLTGPLNETGFIQTSVTQEQSINIFNLSLCSVDGTFTCRKLYG